MSTPYLSIIIPAFNEEKSLPGTLEQAFSFLASQPYTAEVIVVENGSQDRTLQVAQEFARENPALRVMQSQRGKGHAVRCGMLAAGGKYRLMCDADLSTPIGEVERFLPPALGDADIAIGSREAPGAVRYREPYYRHLVGRVFNGLIQTLLLPGLQDTQCGFKCFRGELANEVFGRQTLGGWAFDVEILFIARRLGYRIVELPIPSHYNPGSKVRVLSDSVRMGLDLLTIRLNGWRGVYDVRR